MSIVVNILGGVIGGVCLGLLGYMAAKKDDETLKLDMKKFVYSIVPAIIGGLLSGIASPDFVTSILAGFSGKALMERFSDLTR